jgi:hypothetical protein
MSNLTQFNAGGLLKFNKNQSFTANTSSAQSAAFDSDTVAIIVSAKGNDEILYFTIGANPTATSGDFYYRAFNIANDGYGGGYYIGPIGVTGGEKLAALTDSSSLSVTIMELKY